MTGFILCRCVSERKPLNRVVSRLLPPQAKGTSVRERSLYVDNLLSSFVVNETFKNAVES